MNKKYWILFFLITSLILTSNSCDIEKYQPFVISNFEIGEDDCLTRVQVSTITESKESLLFSLPTTPPCAGYKIQIMGNVFFAGKVETCMGNGAEYQILNKIEGDGISIVTDTQEYPLTFKAIKVLGYVYLCGKGIVKTGKVEVKLGYDETIETWITRLGDNRQYVREGAAEALGWLVKSQDVKQKAVSALINSLKDKSWEVRRNTIEALARIGEAKCISSLQTLIDRDNNQNVQEAIKLINKEKVECDKQGLIGANPLYKFKFKRVNKDGDAHYLSQGEYFIGFDRKLRIITKRNGNFSDVAVGTINDNIAKAILYFCGQTIIIFVAGIGSIFCKLTSNDYLHTWAITKQKTLFEALYRCEWSIEQIDQISLYINTLITSTIVILILIIFTTGVTFCIRRFLKNKKAGG